MLRNHKEQVAINLLINLLVSFVFHIVRVFIRNTVDDDLLWELYGKSIFVNGDFLYVISTSNLNSCLCD
jgi:hypothetical protein